MLNQTTRYVLSVLCYLATRRQDLVPAHQIAADTGTPPNYVAKILGTFCASGAWWWPRRDGAAGYALRAPVPPRCPWATCSTSSTSDPGPVECPFPEPHLWLPGGPRSRRRRPGPAAARREPRGRQRSLCPYGAVECVNPVPCPLQAHWGKVREGFRKLSTTRVGELTEVASGEQGCFPSPTQRIRDMWKSAETSRR